MDYTELIARNVRAARRYADLSQADVGARMKALGFDTWLGQTVSTVERGKRRVTADEVLGLCAALECTPAALLLPVYSGTADVALPAGQLVRLSGRNADEITLLTAPGADGSPGRRAWIGNKPNFRTDTEGE